MALKSKKQGFQYKPRTADQVKERASRKSARFDSIYKSGFDKFRLKQGDNLFRYLPPTWDDAGHYGYTIFVHYGIGPNNAPYLCLRKMLNKPCPICEASKAAKDAGEADEAKELQPAERVVSWVLDRDADDPERPMIFECSWTQDQNITSLCVNERTGEILMIDHPDKGYDVTVKRAGKTKTNTTYYGQQIARVDSPIHDDERAQDEILDYVKENPIPDILNYHDYDYIAVVMSGTVAEKDAIEKDDDEQPVQTKPKTAIKGRRVEEVEEEEVPFETTTRRGPRRDQELDEEEEDAKPVARSVRRQVVEETEEEQEEAPPPRRSARKPEPVDEEVDEETGEVTERPARRSETAAVTRSSGRTRVIEEVVDEEDEPAPRRAARPSVRR
jgi:hypothetical protein